MTDQLPDCFRVLEISRPSTTSPVGLKPDPASPQKGTDLNSIMQARIDVAKLDKLEGKSGSNPETSEFTITTPAFTQQQRQRLYNNNASVYTTTTPAFLQQQRQRCSRPGANPTTLSYNASAVKIYNPST
jgi:hypothetical protein